MSEAAERYDRDHCRSCGKLWVDHYGIEPTCAELIQLRKERDELRASLADMTSNRDAYKKKALRNSRTK